MTVTSLGPGLRCFFSVPIPAVLLTCDHLLECSTSRRTSWLFKVVTPSVLFRLVQKHIVTSGPSSFAPADILRALPSREVATTMVVFRGNLHGMSRLEIRPSLPTLLINSRLLRVRAWDTDVRPWPNYKFEPAQRNILLLFVNKKKKKKKKSSMTGKLMKSYHGDMWKNW